jgi:hypothetical protein
VRGEAGYERTRALLAERGFTEDEVMPYTGDDFGSWAIALSHAPRLRIVWDGKDGWVIIQWEGVGVPRPPGYSPWEVPWEDLWIGKQPEDVTPDAVVKALEQLCAFANAARRGPA